MTDLNLADYPPQALNAVAGVIATRVGTEGPVLVVKRYDAAAHIIEALRALPVEQRMAAIGVPTLVIDDARMICRLVYESIDDLSDDEAAAMNRLAVACGYDEWRRARIAASKTPPSAPIDYGSLRKCALADCTDPVIVKTEHNGGTVYLCERHGFELADG